jgi:putative hydrolase of the HAD superfamily
MLNARTRPLRPPLGLLLDYGGTLVEEVSLDLSAGHAWMLAQAASVPEGLTPDAVLARAERVTREVDARRNGHHIEVPYPALARLIFDPLGVRFDRPWPALELGFWRASVRTAPMPGARDALAAFHRAGLKLAVVSNTGFGEPVIRAELERHGLTEHLDFVMVSSDYGVRKPLPLLFEAAAARLGMAPRDIWFVGDRLDTDVAGAKAAGMTAVWLRPSGAPPSPEPDLDAGAWSGIIEMWHHPPGR